MDTTLASHVMPFLWKAQPEVVLLFNLAVCLGVRLLGPRLQGSRQEPVATVWCTGAAVGIVLVIVQRAASRFAPGSSFLEHFVDERFFFVGAVTALAFAGAARRAAVGRPWQTAALFGTGAFVLAHLTGSVLGFHDHRGPLLASALTIVLALGMRGFRQTLDAKFTPAADDAG